MVIIFNLFIKLLNQVNFCDVENISVHEQTLRHSVMQEDPRENIVIECLEVQRRGQTVSAKGPYRGCSTLCRETVSVKNHVTYAINLQYPLFSLQGKIYAAAQFSLLTAVNSYEYNKDQTSSFTKLAFKDI